MVVLGKDASMTSTPGLSPGAAGGPTSEQARTVSLSLLLPRAVLGAKEQRLGQLADVIVRLRGEDYPLVTGLVADIGGRRIFIPAERVTDWHIEDAAHSAARPHADLKLSTAKLDLREFERRSGEVLLSADILGHRLIDIPQARLVRAYDLQLTRTPAGWELSGVRTRPPRWWRRWVQALRGGDEPAEEGWQDWKAFEALIGHEPSALARTRISRLRRMKPQDIADLLEEASRTERSELLGQVHADPELEADVFEELDEDQQSRLLRDRSDRDIAAVLARMEADDAADALGDLPQERRQPVLELLPVRQRVKVTTLLGYNPTTAGGLMGVDYLAVPDDAEAQDVLRRVRASSGVSGVALSTVYTVDDQRRLRSAVGLVTVVQAEPATPVGVLGDTEPVRVTPATDLISVALLMTDYNLLTLPVVDDQDRILGVITVDDVLDATVPDNWRRREPEPYPNHAPEDTVAEPARPGNRRR
jgi:CBS domain-containing protein